MSSQFPDPIAEAGEKASQYVTLAVMAAEAVAVIATAKARATGSNDEKITAALNTELDTSRAVAAALWAPALDDEQRGRMDASQALAAWAATQAWRPEAEAETASNAAEERLRELRPAAMDRYDAYRTEGMDPVQAMRNVVPLLERDVRVGEPATRMGALTTEEVATARHTGPVVGNEDLPAPTRPGEASSDSASAGPVNTNSIITAADTAALLLTESALLTEIEAHHPVVPREKAAANEALAAGENAATVDDSATRGVHEHQDGHADGVRDSWPRLAVAVSAEGHVASGRSAVAALTASYPVALSDVSAVAVIQAKPATTGLASATSLGAQLPSTSSRRK